MGLNKTRLAGDKPRLWVPHEQFGFLPAAPTINIAGGEAGTVAIGIDSDANGAALSKTAATARTGITGVQAPEVQSLVAATAYLAEIGTKGFRGALMTTGDQAYTMLPIPTSFDLERPVRYRAYWSGSSTTTSEIASLKCSVARLYDGSTIAAAGSGQSVTDSPDSVAHSLMITDWSSDIQATWNQLTAHIRGMMTITFERLVSGDTLSGNFYFIGVEIEAYPRRRNSSSRANADAGAWIGA